MLYPSEFQTSMKDLQASAQQMRDASENQEVPLMDRILSSSIEVGSHANTPSWSEETRRTVAAIGQFAEYWCETAAADRKLAGELASRKKLLTEGLRVLDALILHLPPSPDITAVVVLNLHVEGCVLNDFYGWVEGTMQGRGVNFVRGAYKDGGDQASISLTLESWEYAQFWKNNVGMGDEGASSSGTLVLRYTLPIMEGNTTRYIEGCKTFCLKKTWRERRAHLGESVQEYRRQFPAGEDTHTERQFMNYWVKKALEAIPSLLSCFNKLPKWAHITCPNCCHPRILMPNVIGLGDMTCANCKRNAVSGISKALVGKISKNALQVKLAVGVTILAPLISLPILVSIALDEKSGSLIAWLMGIAVLVFVSGGVAFAIIGARRLADAKRLVGEEKARIQPDTKTAENIAHCQAAGISLKQMGVE